MDPPSGYGAVAEPDWVEPDLLLDEEWSWCIFFHCRATFPFQVFLVVVVVVEGVDAVEVTEVASDTVMPPAEVADVEDVRESTVAADEAFRDLVAGEWPVGERLRDRVIFRLKM